MRLRRAVGVTDLAHLRRQLLQAQHGHPHHRRQGIDHRRDDRRHLVAAKEHEHRDQVHEGRHGLHGVEDGAEEEVHGLVVSPQNAQRQADDDTDGDRRQRRGQRFHGRLPDARHAGEEHQEGHHTRKHPAPRCPRQDEQHGQCVEPRQADKEVVQRLQNVEEDHRAQAFGEGGEDLVGGEPVDRVVHRITHGEHEAVRVPADLHDPGVPGKDAEDDQDGDKQELPRAKALTEAISKGLVEQAKATLQYRCNRARDQAAGKGYAAPDRVDAALDPQRRRKTVPGLGQQAEAQLGLVGQGF